MIDLYQHFAKLKVVYAKIPAPAVHDFDLKTKKRLVIFIILLMTISQATITIYLPSLPYLEHFFNTDHSAMKLSVTLYIISYGISQFIYGTLSDIYGRRIIILVGTTIFAAASLICACAHTIEIFLLGRILQGFGIGCGDTMGRAILCDQFKKNEFVAAAAKIGMASTITPLAAPVIGGYLQEYLSWRTDFIILALYAFLCLGIFTYLLPETKIHSFRKKISYQRILHSYYVILSNLTFIRFFIPGLVCFVGELVYNLMSPFIMQENYQLSPIEYGWLSIYTISGLFIGAMISTKLATRISITRMVRAGLILFTIAGFYMLIPRFFVHHHLFFILAAIFIFMIGEGIVYPNTNTGALQQFTHMAGAAGALQGGLQMIAGGITGILVGMIHSETQWVLASILTIISVFGLCSFVLLERPKTVPA